MPHGSNREIHKRTVGIVIAGAVLLVALLLYGVTVLDRVRGIEGHWDTYSTVSANRDEQIHLIQQELGYGGMIHNFKNFILRGDLSYMDKVRGNLEKIYQAIGALGQEELTESEKAALGTIASTVKVYEKKLEFADNAFMEGMSTNEVDSMVIFDDTATLAAIKALTEASALRLKQVGEATEQQLSSAIRFAALGLLAVPLIILVGFILNRSMLSLARANEEAGAASRRLEGLLDTSPEAMIVADAEGVIVQVNRAATDLLDYDPGEIVGKPLAVLIPEDSQKMHHEKYAVFVKMPKPGVLSIEGDLYAVTKYRREIPVEINLSVMEQDSDLLVTAAIRDITLRLAYENALHEAREKAIAASDEKSRFLANMSHEIRTPINAVIGLSGLALKTDLNAKQLDYARKIYSSGRRLLELVNDVLDFSKLEAGKLDIDRSRFQLSVVIRDVAAMMAVRAEEKQIELIFRVSPDIPDALVGDPLRLGQVLTNLVSNAIKFTEAGTVIVEGCVESVDGERLVLKFSVIDTGIGIPADCHVDLFDAFTQADTSATRRFGGTGLGLTICRNIVDAMGGEIGVTSKPGKGSTFTFTAPLEQDPDADGNGQSVAIIDPPNTRILVVDDSEAACQILAEELSALKFPVDTALSGSEALKTLEEASVVGNPYNLLLLDWHMPGMDGLETVRCIEENPKITTMPTIFVVTAFGSDDARHLADGLSIKAFMDKPLNTSVLVNALASMLSNRGPLLPADGDVEPDIVLSDAVKGKRVLVVEDNMINQQVAREILENEGLLVDTADNGRMALDLVFKQGPDIYSAILMDIQMPEMDGIAATREIRADPSFNEVPIIALTAHALTEDRQRCLDAGMNDHLTKPVIATDLIVALNTWIGGTDTVSDGAIADSGFAGVSEPASESVSDTNPSPVGGGEDVLVLPVLNLEKASSISRLSADFLEELLCDFKDRYQEAASDIHDHLIKGERSEAQTIAHTVKGISGSLGAEQVYAAAIALDAGLKSDAADEVIDPLYEEFATSMSTLLTYIEQNVVRREVST